MSPLEVVQWAGAAIVVLIALLIAVVVAMFVLDLRPRPAVPPPAPPAPPATRDPWDARSQGGAR